MGGNDSQIGVELSLVGKYQATYKIDQLHFFFYYKRQLTKQE